MTDYAYTGLTLSGRYSDDGEYFIVEMPLNGVPIRFATLYVGDQRTLFQQAKDAGSNTAAAEPAAA